MYFRYDHRKRASKQRRKKRRSTYGAAGGVISSASNSLINTYGGFLGAGKVRSVDNVNIFEKKQQRLRSIRKKRGTLSEIQTESFTGRKFHFEADSESDNDDVLFGQRNTNIFRNLLQRANGDDDKNLRNVLLHLEQKHNQRTQHNTNEVLDVIKARMDEILGDYSDIDEDSDFISITNSKEKIRWRQDIDEMLQCYSLTCRDRQGILNDVFDALNFNDCDIECDTPTEEVIDISWEISSTIELINRCSVKLNELYNRLMELFKSKVLDQSNVDKHLMGTSTALDNLNIQKVEVREETWKYAAAEIVELLQFVRNEGVMDLDRIEKEFQSLLIAFSKQGEFVEELKNTIGMQQQNIKTIEIMKEKLKSDNLLLQDDVDRSRVRAKTNQLKINRLKEDYNKVSETLNNIQEQSVEMEKEQEQQPKEVGVDISGTPVGDLYKESTTQIKNLQQELQKVEQQLKREQQKVKELEAERKQEKQAPSIVKSAAAIVKNDRNSITNNNQEPLDESLHSIQPAPVPEIKSVSLLPQTESTAGKRNCIKCNSYKERIDELTEELDDKKAQVFRLSQSVVQKDNTIEEHLVKIANLSDNYSSGRRLNNTPILQPQSVSSYSKNGSGYENKNEYRDENKSNNVNDAENENDIKIKKENDLMRVYNEEVEETLSSEFESATPVNNEVNDDIQSLKRSATRTIMQSSKQILVVQDTSLHTGISSQQSSKISNTCVVATQSVKSTQTDFLSEMKLEVGKRSFTVPLDRPALKHPSGVDGDIKDMVAKLYEYAKIIRDNIHRLGVGTPNEANRRGPRPGSSQRHNLRSNQPQHLSGADQHHILGQNQPQHLSGENQQHILGLNQLQQFSGLNQQHNLGSDQSQQFSGANQQLQNIPGVNRQITEESSYQHIPELNQQEVPEENIQNISAAYTIDQVEAIRVDDTPLQESTRPNQKYSNRSIIQPQTPYSPESDTIKNDGIPLHERESDIPEQCIQSESMSAFRNAQSPQSFQNAQTSLNGIPFGEVDDKVSTPSANQVQININEEKRDDITAETAQETNENADESGFFDEGAKSTSNSEPSKSDWHKFRGGVTNHILHLMFRKVQKLNRIESRNTEQKEQDILDLVAEHAVDILDILLFLVSTINEQERIPRIPTIPEDPKEMLAKLLAILEPGMPNNDLPNISTIALKVYDGEFPKIGNKRYHSLVPIKSRDKRPSDSTLIQRGSPISVKKSYSARNSGLTSHRKSNQSVVKKSHNVRIAESPRNQDSSSSSPVVKKSQIKRLSDTTINRNNNQTVFKKSHSERFSNTTSNRNMNLSVVEKSHNERVAETASNQDSYSPPPVTNKNSDASLFPDIPKTRLRSPHVPKKRNADRSDFARRRNFTKIAARGGDGRFPDIKIDEQNSSPATKDTEEEGMEDGNEETSHQIMAIIAEKNKQKTLIRHKTLIDRLLASGVGTEQIYSMLGIKAEENHKNEAILQTNNLLTPSATKQRRTERIKESADPHQVFVAELLKRKTAKDTENVYTRSNRGMKKREHHRFRIPLLGLSSPRKGKLSEVTGVTGTKGYSRKLSALDFTRHLFPTVPVRKKGTPKTFELGNLFQTKGYGDIKRP